MNRNTVKEFRHAVYGCFQRAGDALFNTIDALLTEDRARSFPELSLSPSFERRWSSLYEAFEDGRIDEAQLKRVLASYLPQTEERWLWTGIAIAHNHLVLAREIVEPELRPWESTHRAPTPQQVHRAMNKLLPQLGTPARAPRPRGKSPGRAKGVKIGKAKRFSIVRKTPKLPPLIPK
ncbi:MAG: hypothetical protein ABI456_21195 [Ktedonobacteraceae bacterium]